MTASDTCGNSSITSDLTFSNTSCLWNHFQNNTGNTASAGYYHYQNADFIAYNKISSASKTCITDSGTIAYETVCKGVLNGTCSKGQKWVSNGCSSADYTAVGTNLKVEGAEFGDCICNASSKYYESNSLCINAGHSSCKLRGDCYVPSCHTLGKYDTMAECQAAGNESCKSYFTETSTGYCFGPTGYFTITAKTNDILCDNGTDSYKLALVPEGTEITNQESYTFVSNGNSVTLPEGKYTLFVMGSTGRTTLAYFRLYKAGGGRWIGDYTNKGNGLGDNGNRTTDGVSACGNDNMYSCLSMEYSFSPSENYVVESQAQCKSI